MSAEALVGIAISQGDLNGMLRVMRLMLHYGWTNRPMDRNTNL